MVTENQLKNFYTTNWAMLEKIAAGISYKKNKDINASATLSESYIYVYNIRKKITMKQLQQVIINYIKQEVGNWSNSQLNLKEGKKRLDTYYIPDKPDDTDDNIESKIEIEIWFNDRKAILALYRQQEQDKIKQIIFDCYFNKGLTKGVDLARHLNINKDYSCKYIRELKNDLREFYKNNK